METMLRIHCMQQWFTDDDYREIDTSMIKSSKFE